MPRTCITTDGNGPGQDTEHPDAIAVSPRPGVRPPAAAALAGVLERAHAIDPSLPRRRVALLADQYSAAAARRCVRLVGGAGRLTARDSVELEASDLWRVATGELGLEWIGSVTILVGAPSVDVLAAFDLVVVVTAGEGPSPADRPAHTCGATLHLDRTELGSVA